MRKSVGRAIEYKYFKEDTNDHISFAKIREKYIKNLLQNIKPKKILVLGCGEGSFAHLVKELTGAQVFGVDYSSSGVKLSNEKGIIAKQADLNKGIPFGSNIFDLIISDQLLEHIYSTDFLLEECYRTLKKGGYIITITPNISYWLNRIIFLFGFYPIFVEVSTKNKTFGQGFLGKLMMEKDVMGHLRVFNMPALIDILKSQKFKIISAIGLPLSFNLPFLLKLPYDLLDSLFAKRPTFARDLMVVAVK